MQSHNNNNMPSKKLVFMGRTAQQMRDMPADARQDAGYQLHRLQTGQPPKDCKPLKTVGPGVMELRIWCEDGTWRVIYIAKYEDAVYVLHVFKKTTQATAQKDLEQAKANLKQIQPK